jgi:hypothetical protein
MSMVEKMLLEDIVQCVEMHVFVGVYQDSICQSNTEVGFKEGQL